MAKIDRTNRNGTPRQSKFATVLIKEWQRLGLPESNASIILAVSGGADSAALLLAVDELIKNGKLQVTPVVAHLNHGLRPESKDDALWVTKLAKDLAYRSTTGTRAVKESASKRKVNLEQAARDARYDFLAKAAGRFDSKFVLTGHTQDDQAETVMMRLLRGSAAEGLTGSSPVRPITEGSDVQLVRPLLTWARRSETENYCRFKGIDFRADSMNEDQSFSRVRVRKQLLPLMQSFNNRIVETLSRTASLLGEDASALSSQAIQLLESASISNNNETSAPALDVKVLANAPAAIRRRALREWILRARGSLRRLETVHLVGVEKLLEGEHGGRVAELPGGMKVARKGGKLELTPKKGLKKASPAPKIRPR
ncbi:MAG TPA: tRNA lysidine(34) synthetase TilS [Pyrinomonadaceae bacterium]